MQQQCAEVVLCNKYAGCFRLDTVPSKPSAVSVLPRLLRAPPSFTHPLLLLLALLSAWSAAGFGHSFALSLQVHQSTSLQTLGGAGFERQEMLMLEPLA